MANLPTGTVTFLFTDIEGSTKLWEQHPEAMKAALAKHDSILKETVESNHGYLIKTTGDGVHAVFTTALDAINAAVASQRNLQTSEFFKNSEVLLRARMGLHTGEAELRDNDYFGQTLNRAARIMSAGHGEQILISAITAQVAREHAPVEVSFLDLGEHNLKGLSQVEKIFQVVAPGLQKDFPPLNSIPTATNNLPAQLTSFIGRERELKEASKKLASAKLLTLIGPGGTGKTRLSIQLGTEVLSHFADGVWFIELAPLADPALVLQTIASVLGVRAQSGMPLKNIVFDFLRAKNLLLIFDNCEHLADACAPAFLDECLARKNGLVSLESEALEAKDPYLHKSLMLAVDGADLEELRAMMELESDVAESRADQEAKVFESAGGFAPTIGIIGAVLGLIIVMGQIDDMKKVGHGIAAAFVATIYGVGSANILFLPAAQKIKLRAARERERQEMILAGVSGIVEGLNPKLIRSKLEAYSPKGKPAAVSSDAKAQKVATPREAES
jgi:class 3 adenylate cyclase/biopolymer transport protein ExbB/TolQ